MTEDIVQMALRHVAAGRRLVEEQEQLVEELRQDGHYVYVKRAEELLQLYQESLTIFEQDLAEITQAREGGPSPRR